MSCVVGIDLGTTFSAVAVMDPATKLPKIVPNREGSNITPSIILFTEDGPVFGSEAAEAFDEGDKNCVSTFKRCMGQGDTYCTIQGRAYTSEELSAILLRHLKEDAEYALKQPIDEAVITVPAYFYSREREATMKAARQAGLKVRKIINEPTAAAIAYGLSHWRNNAKILVYDLGGGTCDVTLITMGGSDNLTTLATYGDHYLGGRDWDARLAGIMAAHIKEESDIDVQVDAAMFSLVKGMAESVKKQLSSLPSAKVSVSLPRYGNCPITVTRQEFDEATRDLIERTGALCGTVLQKAGIAWRDITDILLVGGSTRMPQVPDYLTRLSQGKRPISHVNPDEAVALGAAVQTTLQDPEYTVKMMEPAERETGRGAGAQRPVPRPAYATLGTERRVADATLMMINEVTTHSMGIITVDPTGTEYINETIIPAGFAVPVKSARAFQFHTTSRGDNEMEIYVLQGDKKPLECVIPYKYVVSGIRHVKGGTKIRVQYSYDQNSVIHVQVRQEDDAVDLPIRKEPVPEDMSKYGRPVDPSEFKSAQEMSVMLAVDVSGSMSGNPLSDAKKAMCAFVDQMDMSVTRIGVIAVSDRSEIVQKLTSDAGVCQRAINNIRCEQTGIGNDAHPFKEIMDALSAETGLRHAIVLADGVWSYQGKAIAAANECHQRGIETAAIGFGGADRKFLKEISSSEADALLVNQSELTHAFGKIAQSLGGKEDRGARRGKTFGVDTWEVVADA